MTEQHQNSLWPRHSSAPIAYAALSGLSFPLAIADDPPACHRSAAAQRTRVKFFRKGSEFSFSTMKAISAISMLGQAAVNDDPNRRRQSPVQSDETADNPDLRGAM